MIAPKDLSSLLDENGFLLLSIKRVESPDAIYGSPVFPDVEKSRADAAKFSQLCNELNEFYNVRGMCLLRTFRFFQ